MIGHGPAWRQQRPQADAHRLSVPCERTRVDFGMREGLLSDATIKNHAAFIWSVADRLRGDYKQSEYGKVILPLTVLRRLDCVLEPTKVAVLDQASKLKGKVDNVGPVLRFSVG
jgi:HsdM N-terminal domain